MLNKQFREIDPWFGSVERGQSHEAAEHKNLLSITKLCLAKQADQPECGTVLIALDWFPVIL